MILIATSLVMLACGYAQYRNGLFTSFTMLIIVLVSGMIAFGFWEPIADFLDPAFQNNSLAGCEDMIALLGLFALPLFGLRLATTYLSPDIIEEHGWLQHLGAGVVGIVTGYLIAGFLICAMQTLPIDEKFMDFTPRADHESPIRSIFPGDRVWLALMRHAGANPFPWKEDMEATGTSNVERYFTFDRQGTFELRYQRYRRRIESETGKPMPYFGEFDRELGRQKGP
jgi:hypothetical protein